MEKWENCVERDLEVWKVGLKAEKNQSKNLIYYFPIPKPTSTVRIKLVKVFFTFDYTKYFSSVEKSDILGFSLCDCVLCEKLNGMNFFRIIWYFEKSTTCGILIA